MINIEFLTKGTDDNKYRVTLDRNLELLFKDYDDLYVRFTNIDGSKSWEHKAIPGNWIEWNGGGCLRYNIELYSKEKGVLYTREYNSLIDGDDLERAFTLFCLLNKNSKGIVIGSHDGTWGHWVQSVLDKTTECLIVEGSEKQFKKLENNYKHFENCTLINDIISDNGESVVWHTFDQGFTDSIISDVPLKFVDDGDENKVTKEIRETTSINDLIEKYSYQDFDWLHTDLEGYDAKLIRALKYLPRMIVFENVHIKENWEHPILHGFLVQNGYDIIEFDGDTLAIK